MYERARRVLVRFVVRLLFLVFLQAGFLLPSYFMTVLQEKNVGAEGSQSKQDPRLVHALELERLALQSNKEIQLLQRYLSRGARPGDIVESILAVVAPGADINAVRVDAVKKQIGIEGIARKREDLLQTVASVQSLPFVADIKSPISNIVKESNNPFRLDITLR